MPVKISSKFQVVIPKVVREQLGLKVGDEVTWVGQGRSARLIRIPEVDELMGTLKGYDISGYRDEEDRF